MSVKIAKITKNIELKLEGSQRYPVTEEDNFPW